jgi:hypothetical protein
MVSPARPSDTGSMKVKTSGWSEEMAWDLGCGILILWINLELHNLENKVYSYDSKET